MSAGNPLRIAIVRPGDRSAREASSGEKGRGADLYTALRNAGHDVQSAIYSDEFRDDVRHQLLGVDVALVWMNPIHEGRPRAVLDQLLREVAAAGVFVSAHPDVILKLGTKKVLYDTRGFGWGGDTHLYRNPAELVHGLSSRLPGGPRVLKQHRGSSGDGVFLVDRGDSQNGPVSSESLVRARHAKRGSTDEVMSLSDFCIRCSVYLGDGGMIVDQEFQPRVGEGMVRCYLVRGHVAGFGHQAVNALIPASPGSEPPTPSERFYHPPTMAQYQPLKERLEDEWVPALLDQGGLNESELPMLWDCDFLLGPPDGDGNDTYVLCEINASSVAPYPESAVAYLVEAVATVSPR